MVVRIQLHSIAILPRFVVSLSVVSEKWWKEGQRERESVCVCVCGGGGGGGERRGQIR